MAERVVSPGVFTNEVDQSFLPGGIAQIGAAIVGPTLKGPALVPTQITSYGDFVATFGSFTEESYVPFVVQDYLRNGNVITVTRLLYDGGYSLTDGALAIIAKSGSTQIVTHVLHPTQNILGSGSVVNAAYFEDSVLTDAGSGSFAIKISGSYQGTTSYTEGDTISGSIANTSNKYVTKVFGRSAKSSDYPVYAQYENYNAATAFANIGQVTVELAKISNYTFAQDYSTAATPWLTSQKIGSLTRNLLKFHTLSHGTSVNYETKIGIRDIRLATETADPNGFGSFTVEVRRVNNVSPAPGINNSPYQSSDTDAAPDIVESFTNVNLDPTSTRYVARVIGDRYQTVSSNGDLTINGDYPNMSKYIRVEVDPAVAARAIDKTLVPMGFRAPSSPIPAASGSVWLTPASYATSQVVGSVFNANNYFGFNYTAQNNLNYLAPIPSGSGTGSNSDFYLGDVNQNAQAAFPTLTTAYSGSLESALTAGTFTTNIAVATRKFMIPFQGGFDGARPNLPKYAGVNIAASNAFGFDCSTSTASGTVTYNKAFQLLSNADYYDFNLLVTPGIIDSLHSPVTTLARNLVTNRQDAFYVMDSNVIDATTTAVVSQVTTIDNSYVATYWPWVRITNPANGIPTWVPPSVVVPGVLAYNDAVTAPWYAPAGLNRGGLTSVTDTYKRLAQSDRDTLYTARVNPIANYPNEGIVIWGQKTLQARPSALDRVNVRRLLIAVKKYIASATRYLVFEQNTNETRNRFLNIVNPYMDQVRAQQGLYAFRVVMDGTNNTNEMIDQNILYGQIFLQPTRTAEFIILDFNIQPTGASFPE